MTGNHPRTFLQFEELIKSKTIVYGVGADYL
jgi:hypothetical protein